MPMCALYYQPLGRLAEKKNRAFVVILELSMGMDLNSDLIIDFANVAGVLFALLFYSVILIVIDIVFVINYRTYTCHLDVYVHSVNGIAPLCPRNFNFIFIIFL